MENSLQGLSELLPFEQQAFLEQSLRGESAFLRLSAEKQTCGYPSVRATPDADAPASERQVLSPETSAAALLIGVVGETPEGGERGRCGSSTRHDSTRRPKLDSGGATAASTDGNRTSGLHTQCSGSPLPNISDLIWQQHSAQLDVEVGTSDADPTEAHSSCLLLSPGRSRRQGRAVGLEDDSSASALGANNKHEVEREQLFRSPQLSDRRRRPNPMKDGGAELDLGPVATPGECVPAVNKWEAEIDVNLELPNFATCNSEMNGGLLNQMATPVEIKEGEAALEVLETTGADAPETRLLASISTSARGEARHPRRDVLVFEEEVEKKSQELVDDDDEESTREERTVTAVAPTATATGARTTRRTSTSTSSATSGTDSLLANESSYREDFSHSCSFEGVSSADSSSSCTMETSRDFILASPDTDFGRSLTKSNKAVDAFTCDGRIGEGAATQDFGGFRAITKEEHQHTTTLKPGPAPVDIISRPTRGLLAHDGPSWAGTTVTPRPENEMDAIVASSKQDVNIASLQVGVANEVNPRPALPAVFSSGSSYSTGMSAKFLAISPPLNSSRFHTPQHVLSMSVDEESVKDMVAQKILGECVASYEFDFDSYDEDEESALEQGEHHSAFSSFAQGSVHAAEGEADVPEAPFPRTGAGACAPVISSTTNRIRSGQDETTHQTNLSKADRLLACSGRNVEKQLTLGGSLVELSSSFGQLGETLMYHALDEMDPPAPAGDVKVMLQPVSGSGIDGRGLDLHLAGSLSFSKSDSLTAAMQLKLQNQQEVVKEPLPEGGAAADGEEGIEMKKVGAVADSDEGPPSTSDGTATASDGGSSSETGVTTAVGSGTSTRGGTITSGGFLTLTTFEKVNAAGAPARSGADPTERTAQITHDNIAKPQLSGAGAESEDSEPPFLGLTSVVTLDERVIVLNPHSGGADASGETTSVPAPALAVDFPSSNVAVAVEPSSSADPPPPNRTEDFISLSSSSSTSRLHSVAGPQSSDIDPEEPAVRDLHRHHSQRTFVLDEKFPHQQPQQLREPQQPQHSSPQQVVRHRSLRAPRGKFVDAAVGFGTSSNANTTNNPATNAASGALRSSQESAKALMQTLSKQMRRGQNAAHASGSGMGGGGHPRVGAHAPQSRRTAGSSGAHAARMRRGRSVTDGGIRLGPGFGGQPPVKKGAAEKVEGERQSHHLQQQANKTMRKNSDHAAPQAPCSTKVSAASPSSGAPAHSIAPVSSSLSSSSPTTNTTGGSTLAQQRSQLDRRGRGLLDEPSSYNANRNRPGAPEVGSRISGKNQSQHDKNSTSAADTASRAKRGNAKANPNENSGRRPAAAQERVAGPGPGVVQDENQFPTTTANAEGSTCAISSEGAELHTICGTRPTPTPPAATRTTHGHRRNVLAELNSNRRRAYSDVRLTGASNIRSSADEAEATEASVSASMSAAKISRIAQAVEAAPGLPPELRGDLLSLLKSNANAAATFAGVGSGEEDVAAGGVLSWDQ
mmetsp:Transcript_7554/g.18203  ORF Transcript_7554/g.18203 Transcript_7554/m.18203 type:complete len:1492 (-) Transcript_7554:266-4741(-)|eukprot:CAMPEP_0178987972 /NCGR_PEP_ID=MMETSP0795-20121207/3562_1 /TAXON_ID=88552 /ORGANISM="Amoebophrya sp., Strain Ameob2" /LENGTH=1491 /DNA_ID=CAMNT_0020679215 /DNA_START=296 /DNA_END=4771 /DNA_ORIENTATION=-